MNAAIAVARLGGRARYAGPLGDASDNVSNQLIAAMQREGIDTAGVVRVAGRDRAGVGHHDRRDRRADDRRPIATAASKRRAARSRCAAGRACTLLLADNRFPDFVRPICEAARRRGIPVVLDADRPTKEDDPLFGIPTHVVFSSECLRATTGENDLDAGAACAWRRAPRRSWRSATGRTRCATSPAARCARMPVFKVEAIDTLAAGDVFHAGFALALAEGRDEVAAMRFGAAAAGAQMHAVRRQHGRAADATRSRRFWQSRG